MKPASFFRAACVQMSSGVCHSENHAAIERALVQAKRRRADFVFLPEGCDFLQKDAAAAIESAAIDSPKTREFFAALARKYGIWLHCGSLILRDPQNSTKLVNRSFLFDAEGRTVASYDKIHLFDANVRSNEVYRESDVFTAGKKAQIATTPWGGLGMTICYDLRFPNLYRVLAQSGACFLAVPAAFTEATGKAHWQTLIRARAIESACFVFAAAQCGTLQDGRTCWGQSMIVSPWGQILAAAEREPAVICARVDPSECERIRKRLPTLLQTHAFQRPRSSSSA